MPPDTSLDAGYFEGIFAGDADPWGLESSGYERAKFDHSIAALAGRRYRRALEVGCAQGALTRRLAPLCDALLAIDISRTALDRAAARCRDLDHVSFARMAYPAQTPEGGFDLIVLSEVVYYWSDADIGQAARHIGGALDRGGRVLLVHWTGDTDYPQTGDEAVEKLRPMLGSGFAVDQAERRLRYRLDLWRRG